LTQRSFGIFEKKDRILGLEISFERYSPKEKMHRKNLGLNRMALITWGPAERWSTVAAEHAFPSTRADIVTAGF
jgi:hypothetical protein